MNNELIEYLTWRSQICDLFMAEQEVKGDSPTTHAWLRGMKAAFDHAAVMVAKSVGPENCPNCFYPLNAGDHNVARIKSSTDRT